MNRSTCSTCHAPIIWVISEGDRRMPIDPDKVSDGNIVPIEVDGQRRARVLTGDQLPVEGGAWQSHHRSCPHAEQHRRRKAAAKPRCGVCRGPLDPVLVTAGETVHPTCGLPDDFRQAVTAHLPPPPPDDLAPDPEPDTGPAPDPLFDLPAEETPR